jgi:TetR/AcrR family transcriptional repressor of nem operon
MARPRSFDPEAMIDAAMAVFWQKGFAATAMSDIYAATGLKPGSIYAAFESKEALFRLAFQRYAEHFRASLPQDAHGLAAIRAWLETQVRLATRDPERRGCLIVNTASERGLHPPQTRALADARLAEIRGFFADQLAIAADRGEIGAGLDRAVAADGLLAAVVAIMTLARAGADAATIGNVATAALAALTPPAPAAAMPAKQRRR